MIKLMFYGVGFDTSGEFFLVLPCRRRGNAPFAKDRFMQNLFCCARHLQTPEDSECKGSPWQRQVELLGVFFVV